MKIIKRLLGYIGLLTIVALAAIYFRSVLFPGYINEPVDAMLSEVSSMIGIEIPSYKEKVDVSTGDSMTDEVKPVATEDMETDTGVNMVTVITESVTKTVNEYIGSDEDKEGDVQKDDQLETVVGKDNKSGGVESIFNKTAQTIDGSIEYLAEKLDTSNDSKLPDSGKMLIQARTAFWQGNMEEAEKAYRELTGHEELAANAYGELGNVYYAQGKWQEAGRAYYEAAVRLIELEQSYQVNYLLRVIQGLDSESAEKLKQKISG